MELTSSTSTGTLDTDTQTPPPSTQQHNPSFSFTDTNGFLNRRRNTASSHPPSTVVSYNECLRNHAATIGGHALDGCGEFMPSSEPRSLTCAACGCHRNFHRPNTQKFPNPTFISFYPSPQLRISPSPSESPSPSPSLSPPPVSHNFPSSATHVLLSLGNGCYGDVKRENPNGKKRHRTKFSEEQKEKMFEFCEKLGWRMPNTDHEGIVEEFCNSIGVSRGIFKVWMHNNKNRKRLLQIENAPPLDEKINGDLHSTSCSKPFRN